MLSFVTDDGVSIPAITAEMMCEVGRIAIKGAETEPISDDGERRSKSRLGRDRSFGAGPVGERRGSRCVPGLRSDRAACDPHAARAHRLILRHIRPERGASERVRAPARQVALLHRWSSAKCATASRVAFILPRFSTARVAHRSDRIRCALLGGTSRANAMVWPSRLEA